LELAHIDRTHNLPYGRSRENHLLLSFNVYCMLSTAVEVYLVHSVSLNWTWASSLWQECGSPLAVSSFFFNFLLNYLFTLVNPLSFFLCAFTEIKRKWFWWRGLTTGRGPVSKIKDSRWPLRLRISGPN
jgi:hypothetical protein